MTDLDGLTALLAAATPGPWRHDGTPIVEWHHGQRNPFTDQGGGIEAGPEWDDRLNTPQPTVVIQGGAQDEQGGAVGILRDPDAALIVAAVNALPSLIEAARREAGLRDGRPKVVCLCGSTRFAASMNIEAERQTLAGYIVVRPEVVAYNRERDPQFVESEVKAALDLLHLRKIDLADEVVVVTEDHYIGESTTREIAYARQTGKPVLFHEYENARLLHDNAGTTEPAEGTE